MMPKDPNYFYKFYKTRIKKHVPKCCFAINNALGHATNGVGGDVETDEKKEENKKYIKKIFATDFSGVGEINFKKSANPKVSIVIPAYNKWQFTYHCLRSIQENTQKIEFEVIVVDNASSDDTKLLFEKVTNVKYLRNDENLGFSRACNQGARAAKGKYLLFLNNDTVVKKHWLQPLVSELDKNKKTSIVGSKLLFPNNTIQHAGVGFGNDKIPRHIFYMARENYESANKKKRLNAVTGACLMIRREDFFQAGGFDERYVNGLEDIDLCLKVGELGKKIIYIPKSVLYHYESISEGRFLYTKKNTNLFLEKWDGKIISDYDKLNKDSLDIVIKKFINFLIWKK